MCRRFPSVFLCVVVLLALSVSTALADLARPVPWLNGVTTDSVYVVVEANNTANATVEFGQTTSYGTSITTAYTQPTGGPGGGPNNYVHNIKLTGLSPNTQYHYRVTQGSSVTSDYSFWTAPSPGTPAKWGFAADSRRWAEVDLAAHDTMTGLIASHAPRMMVYGGDIAYDYVYSAWDLDWFRPPQIALNATTPWVNATGNHEKWGFNESVAFTQAPDRDGDDPAGNMGWYSFDYGDTHILIINTEVDHSSGSAQWNFVAADLAASERQWNVVAFHYPAYGGRSSFDVDMRDMTTQIFEPNDVDLILTGNNHYYQHNVVNGIPHMVLGTFGTSPEVPVTASYTVYSEQTRNFGIIETTATTLTLTTYRQNGGTVIETIELTKGGAPGDATSDLFVGGADITQVIHNWGIASPSWADGDVWDSAGEQWGSDGVIDQDDYDEVVGLLGTDYSLSEPGESSGVPEPATLALMLLGGLALLRKRS